jgi:hypothetical protein
VVREQGACGRLGAGLALADDQTPVPLTPAELKGITPLAAVVQRNWPRWSAGNAVVTKLDLITQIAKPEYQGEDAVGVTAISLNGVLRPANVPASPDFRRLPTGQGSRGRLPSQQTKAGRSVCAFQFPPRAFSFLD